MTKTFLKFEPFYECKLSWLTKIEIRTQFVIFLAISSFDFSNELPLNVGLLYLPYFCLSAFYNRCTLFIPIIDLTIFVFNFDRWKDLRGRSESLNSKN